MRRFTVTLLCAIALVALPAPASSAKPGPGVPVQAPIVDAASRSAWRKGPAVSWPIPGVAEVDGSADGLQRAGSLPIWLGQSAAVELLGAGDGLRFRISKARRQAPIEVDYSSFRYAFGGDYAARLQLTRVDGRPMRSRNDITRGRVIAAVGDGVYQLTAESSSSAGTYQATALAPSATWQVGLGSGDFVWSYPIATPQLPGPNPELSLSYNSGAVDGRIGSTNNQPSVVGEGFELRTGYIERSYQSCANDGQAGVNDLCFLSQNATVVLPGLTSELVRDDVSGKWSAQRDSGWRIEQLFGAANGDNDGEHWRLTSPGGVQYFFGSSNAWTVPVYGDDAGEPCKQTTFAASWCQQTYRWNLEKVVDPHGDAMSYFYEKETNNYNRGGTITPYVRSGHLARIEYGSARVLLTSAGRCIPGSTCSSTTPGNFPDVPYDQECSTSSCAYSAPTFWSTKRLAKITTQVNGLDVDSWTLTHSFPGGGTSDTPALWLESIVRTGHVGGTVTLPAVRFSGSHRQNRVDTTGDGVVPLNKYRVEGVSTETGGQIQVNYAVADCVAGSTPAPDSNVRKCFPAFWNPAGTGIKLDWFHKYVVNEVMEQDLVAGQAQKLTRYEYVDPGAVLWSHDDSEVVPAVHQSWGQWRGYQKVRVRIGNSLTEHLILRGLYDDKVAGGSKRLTIVDGVEDRAAFNGVVRQKTVLDGSNVVSRTISQPLIISTTATRVRSSGTLTANLVDEQSVRTLSTLAAGGVRTIETRYGYDSRGRLIHTSDLGDTSITTDDVCTRNTYAENVTSWIIDTKSRVEQLGADCDSSGALLAEVRNTYNEHADLTKVEQWNGTAFVTTAQTVPDQHGRPLEQRDASGHLTRTAYSPMAGGPVTRTVVTNPLGHTVTTDFEPLRGTTSSTVDANGNRTTTAYDALGRLTGVWLPGRATSLTANTRYEYLIPGNGPSVVTTRTLLGPLRRELFDGLSRSVQTQTSSPAGGRVVTGTVYDGNGRVSRAIDDLWDAGAPGTSLLATPSTPDRETRYGYDAAGRVISEALYSGGTQQWRTTTSYGGDRTTVDAPSGGIDTTSVVDAAGRIVELRQYNDVTRYSYTRLGQLATTTDPLGNVRRNTYNAMGHLIKAEAPDTGTVTMGYDNEGRLLSKQDARGRVLTYAYDSLDRQVTLHEGTVKLAEWTYDTAPGGAGRPASSTRYSAGFAYARAVTAYDQRGAELGVTVTVPTAETGLGGTYTTAYTYREDGQPATVTLPAAGGLAQETVSYGYDDFGNPTTMSGYAQYVAATVYDELGAVYTRSSGPDGSQVHRQYGWDPATRRLAYSAAYRDVDAQPILADRAYGYDPAGNVTSIVDALDESTVDTQCFKYDGLQRLTEAWTAAAECSATPQAAGPVPYWHRYTYDKIGNRLSEVAGGVTRTYNYQTTQPHLVRSTTANGVTANYGYDASGNTTSRPGQTLTWDAEGRLTSNDSSTYVYDADGNRLIRREPAGTTVYLGHTDLHRGSSGAITATRHYQHNGTLVAMRTAARTSWLVADHHGTSQIEVADQTGLPFSRRFQTPFAGMRGAAPTWWDGNRGFLDGAADATGLVHLGAREYDPVIGRFVSADPVVDTTDPQQMHGYSYANGNPVTLSDADGRKPKPPPPPKPKDQGCVTCFVEGELAPFDNYSDYWGDELDFGYDVYGYDDYGYDDYDYEEPSVQYVYEPRGCTGWGGIQCVTPRPYEWVPVYSESFGSSSGSSWIVSSRSSSDWRPTPITWIESPRMERWPVVYWSSMPSGSSSDTSWLNGGRWFR